MTVVWLKLIEIKILNYLIFSYYLILNYITKDSKFPGGFALLLPLVTVPVDPAAACSATLHGPSLTFPLNF
jgi:hypothetical protein